MFSRKCEYAWKFYMTRICNSRRMRGMYHWYRAKCQHNTFLLHYIARYQLFDCIPWVLVILINDNTSLIFFARIKTYCNCMWCKNTQYRTSPTQVLIEYRWNRNKLSSISISILSFLSFLVGYVIFSPFLMSLSSCSLSNVKLSQPPVDIKFLAPLQTIFSFFVHPYFVRSSPVHAISFKISHLLFGMKQRFKFPHTRMQWIQHPHTHLWMRVGT